MSNIERSSFALNVRRNGPQPSIFVRLLSAITTKLLVESQQNYHIDLVGPTRKNYHWQASQKTGYDANHFLINWEEQQATCPEGTPAVVGLRPLTIVPTR